MHHGAVAVVDAAGRLRYRAGDPDLRLFLRSSAKPLQAIPVIESGAADTLGLTDRELAVVCGSHAAEPMHVAAVRSILSKAGLDDGFLQCGAHPPFDAEQAALLAHAGQAPGPVHNNCSGKHAGMLAVCRVRGWPLDTYRSPEHPLQQEIAGIIQQALLPTPSVRLPGLAIAGRYVPSREVGGDFYAALPLGQGKVGLAIADVSGKGIRAAALSARARYLLEAFALEGRSSEAVLGQMNAVLTRDAASDLLVSLFYGVIDPDAGTLRCTSAGHPPPLVLRAGAPAPEALGVPGLLLGVDAGARYSAIEVRVGPGDLLVLFTDGITEARRGAGEEFGDHRLGDYMVELRDAQPEDIADEVMRAVAQWSGDSPKDDQALVVVRVLPWGTNVPGGPIGGGTVPTHTA